MWFRVEFQRDGSVKSTEPVESRGTDQGGLVCFIDSDTKATAISDALRWRERYLQSAAERRRRQVKQAKESLRCRNCLSRTVVKGLLTCQVCRDLDAERRNSLHLVLGGDGIPAEKVYEKVFEIYGSRKVSLETIRSALSGDPVNQDVAMRTARAVRELGGAGATSRIGKKAQGGGRYSSREHQLNILLEVRAAHERMTRAQFSRWLEQQISQRMLVEVA